MLLENYEKNINTKQYKVIITPTAYKEIDKIYNYIINELYSENAAKKLMLKIEKIIQNLKYTPKIHAEIQKKDELKRTYRRISIKNYIILYTIDEEKNVVYISHVYYNKRNYIYNNLL